MIGAIGVYARAYRLLKNRRAPLLDDRFHLPTSNAIVTGSPSLLLFAAAMVTGMLGHAALSFISLSSASVRAPR